MAKLRSQNGLGQKYLLRSKAPPHPHPTPFSVSRTHPIPLHLLTAPSHQTFFLYSALRRGEAGRSPSSPLSRFLISPQIRRERPGYHRSHFNRQEDSPASSSRQRPPAPHPGIAGAQTLARRGPTGWHRAVAPAPPAQSPEAGRGGAGPPLRHPGRRAGTRAAPPRPGADPTLSSDSKAASGVEPFPPLSRRRSGAARPACALPPWPSP